MLYIIVGHLCPPSFKHFIFYKAPPSDKHSLLWLASWHSALWLAEHLKHQKCNAPSPASAFKIKVKTVVNFSSVKAQKGNRVLWQTQWWCSYVFAVHKLRLRRQTAMIYDGCTLRCDVTLFPSHTHTHTHTHNSTLCTTLHLNSQYQILKLITKC